MLKCFLVHPYNGRVGKEAGSLVGRYNEIFRTVERRGQELLRRVHAVRQALTNLLSLYEPPPKFRSQSYLP